MPISNYQKEKNMELKRKAFELYKQGLTLREIKKALGQKSHEWFRQGIKELSTVETLTGLDKVSGSDIMDSESVKNKGR